MGAESKDTAIGRSSGWEEECDCEEFALSGYTSLVGGRWVLALGNVDGADATGGEAGGDCTTAEVIVEKSVMARDSASPSTPLVCIEDLLRREKRDIIQRITLSLGLKDDGGARFEELVAFERSGWSRREFLFGRTFWFFDLNIW
jgi:hypothetical protein